MKALLVIGIIVLILGVTNPSEEEYNDWFVQQMKDRNESEILNFGIDLLGPNYVEEETSYTNYIIFSLFKTELPNSTEVTTLGVFNNFFLVSKSDKEQEASIEVFE